ncbi:tRNA (adenosine(37)-N6)-dimethylallyltransferase MiaA [Acidothermaceae bacterium B102]|nr:tRNA (adenosine(37)-N6)-dimethylallyltransferase MiaA [Acidothermaceae bacterium B102]
MHRTPGRVVAVVGPTAAGKSDLGIWLAQQLGGEVVNADSMQLYRGMDIGTAKLAPQERQGVAHHLLDVWDIRDEASVAAYQTMARATIDDLLSRGVTPVLVGGSGLYVRAVLDDLRFPDTDPLVRLRLEAELAERGAPAMHAQLAQVDPASAAIILPTNGRRTIRAIEVYELTGAPFVAILPGERPVYDAVQIGIDIDYALLDERIEARTDRMWQLGLVEEVRALEAQGLRAGLTARRALGYAQVLKMFTGLLTEDQARAETAQTTRRFARKQRSWFKRDPGITWLPVDQHLQTLALERALGT